MRVGYVFPLAHDFHDHVSDEWCRVRVPVLVTGIAGLAQGSGSSPAGRNSGTVVRIGATRGRGHHGAGRTQPQQRGRADEHGQLLVGVHASDCLEADTDLVNVIRLHAAVRLERVDHVLGVRAARFRRAVGQHPGHRSAVCRPRAGQLRLLRLAWRQAENTVRRLERRHGRVNDRHSTDAENIRQHADQLRLGRGIFRVRVLVPVGNSAVTLDTVQRIVPADRSRYL